MLEGVKLQKVWPDLRSKSFGHGLGDFIMFWPRLVTVFIPFSLQNGASSSATSS